MTPRSKKSMKHVRAQVTAALANNATKKTKKNSGCGANNDTDGFVSAIKSTLAMSAKPSAKVDVGSVWGT